MGALALCAIVLGHVGYTLQLRSAPDATYSFLDVLYLDLMLFTLQMGEGQPPFNVALNVARFLAPAVAGYTALQALSQLFADELQSLRLRFLRGHVVVAGLGRKGLILARGFLDRGQSVVVIEQDAENDFVRQCRDLGATVLIGDAAQDWLLRKAGVGRAAHLFAVCGDDGMNAEVAVRADRVVHARRGAPLLCVVHIFDDQLCALLRERELDATASGRMRLEFFNVFDLGARVLLEDTPIVPAGGDVGHATRRLVVVGLGRLAESLVVHAARQWHVRPRADGGRIHVTLIDRRASEITDEWVVRYPSLARTCELVPVDVDVRSAAFRQTAYLGRTGATDGAACAFVCLDNDSLALSAALALAGHARGDDPTIVVRMAQNAGLATLIDGTAQVPGALTCLRAFGLLDRACHPDQVLRGTREILARAVHEEYVSQQTAAGVTPADNASMASWEHLPEHLKESNRQQADDIGTKLALVRCGVAPLLDWDEPLFGFTPEEVDRLARWEHQRWMAEKAGAGWRYGSTKNARGKTHPCLVPYDELPAREREKDLNAVRQIPALLAKLGFRVQRAGDSSRRAS